MNILLGSFFSTFSNIKKKGNHETTEKWFEIQKKVLNVEPFSHQLPKTLIKLKLLKFFSSKFYKRAILFIIIFNFLLLSIKYDGAPERLLMIINAGSILLTFIYGIEVVSKIYCYGFSTFYIFNNKFRLELSIFAIYFLDFFMFVIINDKNISDTRNQRVLDSLKFLAIVRFLNIIKSLKYLFRTLLFSLPLLLNLMFLILISFLVYGNIGVYLFHDIKEGSILNEQLNFNHIFNAFMVLFKCLTCDNWGDIMFDTIDGMKNTRDYSKGNLFFNLNKINEFIS